MIVVFFAVAHSANGEHTHTHMNTGAQTKRLHKVSSLYVSFVPSGWVHWSDLNLLSRPPRVAAFAAGVLRGITDEL